MVQKDAKVSIILPTYNGAKYIRRSIDSCLQQTYKNIELIIVDDGSIDETPRIIDSYKDNRIRYLRHDKNRGLPNALNTGFAEASGDYLTWTSDDNYYALNAIERMFKFSRDNKCHFVYCNYYWFNDENPSNLNLIKKPDVPAFKIGNSIGACFLYSSEVKKAVGEYDPDTFLAEDYDYWIRVSQKFPMCHLNEPLYFFRVHDNSLTSRFEKQFDIQIISYLVLLKNNVLDVEQTTKQLINLVAIRKNMTRQGNTLDLSTSFINKLYAFSTAVLIKCKLEMYRSLAFFRFSNNIQWILKECQKGNISFCEAKSELKTIIYKD